MNVLTAYHPALLGLQSLFDQYPSALGLYVFCNDNGIKTYHVEGKNKVDFIPIDITTNSLKPKIQLLRQAKKELIWGDIDDLPIIKRKREVKQLSIQDEIEQNVLVLRTNSLTDDSSDVFAICFSKTFSNFFIPSGRNVLSSELKKSIGKTILGQLNWLYDLYKNQKGNIERIQFAYQQNSDELEQAELLLHKEQEANRNLLAKYLQQLIKGQEVNLNCTIELKDGFLDKIKTSEIPIEKIKSIVENAVITAYDLALSKDKIVLSPNLIRINTRTNETQTRTIPLIELDKTEALLERYESAARILEQKSLSINGRNLASELQISGPAITDAIKKHNSKIKRLLEKYPNRWVLICDFIKPIRELKWLIEREA